MVQIGFLLWRLVSTFFPPATLFWETMWMQNKFIVILVSRCCKHWEYTFEKNQFQCHDCWIKWRLVLEMVLFKCVLSMLEMFSHKDCIDFVLHSHGSMIHSVEKPYQCKTCDKRFLSFSAAVRNYARLIPPLPSPHLLSLAQTIIICIM